MTGGAEHQTMDCPTGAVAGFLARVPAVIQEILPEVLKLRDTRTTKTDGSFVTQGDLLVQTTLLDLVGRMLPGASIVSEERPVGDSGGGTELGAVVVVDPIDGTENFTSGMPEWGVSVAVYSAGRPAGFLIGCPELETWLKTGERVARFQSRIRGLSSSLTKEEILNATQGYEYRVLGCCVYNMINVIRGSFVSFENPKGANSWDILAGLNLALEHKLKATVEGEPYAGEYLPPNRKYRFKIEQQ